MPHKPHCPVSVLVYDGNLIVAADANTPKSPPDCPRFISTTPPP